MIYLREERLCESKVSQHNVPIQTANPDMLEIAKKFKNQMTGCLHRLLTTELSTNKG